MSDPLDKLRRFREKRPDSREVLDLAERLLGEKCRKREKGAGVSFPVDSAKAKNQMEQGFPFVRPADVPLQPFQVDDYFSCLLKGFEEVNPSNYDLLRKGISTKPFDLDGLLKRLLANQLSERNLEEEFGAAGSLLFFFLIQSLKPAFENLAQAWRACVGDLPWDEGFCPFCGGFPGMGEIRKEGRRFLHCPLCSTEWEYPRMKCPYCGNEDQEKLTYFQVEGESENRVDICRSCGKYLKTIDSRDMEGSLDFEVEDFLTLHLDHLAHEEGFSRPENLFVEMK